MDRNTFMAALAYAHSLGIGQIAREVPPEIGNLVDYAITQTRPRSDWDRGGYQKNPGEGMAAMMSRLGAGR